MVRGNRRKKWMDYEETIQLKSTLREKIFAAEIFEEFNFVNNILPSNTSVNAFCILYIRCKIFFMSNLEFWLDLKLLICQPNSNTVT